MEFCEILSELRKEKRLFQDDIAKIVNVSKSTISNWEKGKQEPSIDCIKKLSAFFNVPTDYLLGLEDDGYTSFSSFAPSSELTTEERELIDTFRRMTNNTRAIALNTMHALAGDNERGKGILNKRA